MWNVVITWLLSEGSFHMYVWYLLPGWGGLILMYSQSASGSTHCGERPVTARSGDIVVDRQHCSAWHTSEEEDIVCCCGWLTVAGWLGWQRMYRSFWCCREASTRSRKHQSESADTWPCHHCACRTCSTCTVQVSTGSACDQCRVKDAPCLT